MTAKVTQAKDFFVVGGPVQPDRPCYIRRQADEELLAAIAAQQFAYVLAPRASGKSSLMGRSIRRLRADGQLAAVIDFNQIAPRGETVDSARWHYSIAYRICRELRLKVDLQDWWHDKNLLMSEQRLVEFFWDVVLANTSAPVTIFFDEAERAADLPFAGDLFAALHSCYMRRVSEPDFTRLNFVVLGSASREQLSPDPNASPFISGRAIRLEDFTLEECQTLARGFGEAEAGVDTLIARIYAWTHGQPYLTQKLARGVARRGGRPADVDAALHDLFLGPRSSREEPLLAHMRSLLTGDSPRRRQAAALLGRLDRGQEVIDDPASPAQKLLDLAGLISADDNGMLRFRNRIVEQVFGGDWIRSVEPGRWQRPAAIGAAAAAALALVGYWYLSVLPAPYIEMLESGTDYERVEQAYARLERLPGFGATAESLFTAAMLRRSREAESIEAVRAADTALRSLPGNAALADRQMADYWQREAQRRAAAGERDAALLHALAAAEGGSMAAASLAMNLIDGDYARLERTLALEAPPLALAVDWERAEAVIVDETRRVRRWSLGGPDASGAAPVAGGVRTLPQSLDALQQIGVTRAIFVDEPGLARSLQLTLTVEHERPGDLMLRLRAPSGIAAELELPVRDGGLERYVIAGADGNSLARLANESITGQWELTLFDRLSGETGRLLSWGLRFPGVPQPWDDAPVNGLPLPDPVRTAQVAIELAADGRFAVAIPARADARGAASVFDLTSGERIADLPLTDRVDALALFGPERLLIVGPRRATLWNPQSGALVAAIGSAGGFAMAPIVSPDRRHLALVETVGGLAQISLHAVADGARLGRFTTAPAEAWALAADTAWLAAVDGSRRGRLLDPVTGAVLAEFFHERELVGLVAGGGADRVIAIDGGGSILAWPVEAGRVTLTPEAGIALGATPDRTSIGIAADGARLAWHGGGGQVAVIAAADGRRLDSLDHGAAGPVAVRLAPDGSRLVSVSASRLRHWRVAGTRAESPRFGPISAVALDPEGRFGMLGFRNGRVSLLPGLPTAIASGAATGGATVHRGVITSLAIDAEGVLAASGSSDGVIRVWNTGTGLREAYVLRHAQGPIRALAFDGDRRWLVSAGPTSARVHDLASGTDASEIEVDGEPGAVAIAADGLSIAVGDSSGNIYLASPGASAGVRTLRASSGITALAFAEDAAMLASGSENGELIVFDPLAVSVLASRRLAGPVHWLDVAPDGIRVASGSWLHHLELAGDRLEVRASSLLPAALRADPSLTSAAGGRVLALADAGGGRLLFDSLPLAPPAEGAALPDASAGVESAAALAPRTAIELPERDWPRVLGLMLERETGRLVAAGR